MEDNFTKNYNPVEIESWIGWKLDAKQKAPDRADSLGFVLMGCIVFTIVIVMIFVEQFDLSGMIFLLVALLFCLAGLFPVKKEINIMKIQTVEAACEKISRAKGVINIIAGLLFTIGLWILAI